MTKEQQKRLTLFQEQNRSFAYKKRAICSKMDEQSPNPADWSVGGFIQEWYSGLRNSPFPELSVAGARGECWVLPTMPQMGQQIETFLLYIVHYIEFKYILMIIIIIIIILRHFFTNYIVHLKDVYTYCNWP